MTLEEALKHQNDKLEAFRLGARTMREEINLLLAKTPVSELAYATQTYWNEHWGDDEGDLGGKVSYLVFNGTGLAALLAAPNEDGHLDSEIKTGLDYVSTPMFLVAV